MNHIAHMSFQGGGLLLPAHTPYEREVLVECVEAATKRYGRVQLEVDGRQWTIRMSRGRQRICASCSQWPHDLTYPGGAGGLLAVVSSRAATCLDTACALAQAAAHA